MNPENFELLVTREMPFGKHKGQLITDLSGNYLDGVASEDSTLGKAGRLLGLMHEIDRDGLTDILKPLR